MLVDFIPSRETAVGREGFPSPAARRPRTLPDFQERRIRFW